MCGIVFAGGNLLTARDVEFFATLLYMDVVRGEHSTGVFAGYGFYDKSPFQVHIRKAAVPADIFLRTPSLWNEVKELKYPSPSNKTIMLSKTPKFLVGHNRYATMGEINDKNAHPFQHGAITLVHNGTLDNQSLLPDHTKFAVDSENIAHSINLIGIEETIKKLNGKFTLVWHDARDQTLNFIRNKDRPFHFAETHAGDWFGASEEDMLMWLCDRPKGPSVKRHFEAEVGVQYVFDVSDNNFKFKEERKHELPVFRTSYQGYQGSAGYAFQGYGRGYTYWDDDSYDNWGSQNPRRGAGTSNVTQFRQPESKVESKQSTSNASQATQDSLNKQLADYLDGNMKLGDTIQMESYQFDPYPNGPCGKITGYVADCSEYIEIQAPGFPKDNYVEGAIYEGEIVSCFVQNYCLHIIMKNARVPKQAEEQTMTVSNLLESMAERLEETTSVDDIDIGELIDLEEEAVQAVTEDGTLVSKKAWESDPALNCCAQCGSPIPWVEAETATIEKGNSFCKDCWEGRDNPKDGGSETIKVEEPVKTAREVLVIRKKLTNGMMVTRDVWNKMNVCFSCNCNIWWEEAEHAGFLMGRTFCPECLKND